MNKPQKLKISRINQWGEVATQKRFKQKSKNKPTDPNSYLIAALGKLQSLPPPKIHNEEPLELDVIEMMLIHNDIEIISAIIETEQLCCKDKVLQFQTYDDENMTIWNLCGNSFTGLIEISDDELTDNEIQSYVSYDENDIAPLYCGKILSKSTSFDSIVSVETMNIYQYESFYELCDKYRIRNKYMDIFEHQLGIVPSDNIKNVIEHHKPGDLIKSVYQNQPNTRDLISIYKLMSYCVNNTSMDLINGDGFAQAWINLYNCIDIWYYISPEAPLLPPSDNKLKNKLKKMSAIMLHKKAFYITKNMNYTNGNLSKPQNIIDIYIDELATDMSIMLIINGNNKSINILCDSRGVVYEDNVYKHYLVRPFDNGSMLEISMMKNKVLFKHSINNNIISKCEAANVCFYEENASELSIQVIIGQRQGNGKYFVSV